MSGGVRTRGVRVSVLMPVHNGLPHVRAALGSILCQTLHDLECVVVDDGSTDGTPEYLQSVRDERLRVIATAHRGMTAALNVGLAACTGDLVARQDADDVSHAGRLKKQAGFLEGNPDVALLGGGVRLIDESGRALGERRFPTSHDALVRRLHAFENPFPHTTVMFRRAALEVVGGYREWFSRAQDYDLSLRLVERYHVANLDDVLCDLRYRRGSSSLEDGGAEQAKFGMMAYLLADVRRRRSIDLMLDPRWPALSARYEAWFARSSPRRILSSGWLRRRARMEFGEGRWGAALRTVAVATVRDPLWPLMKAGVLSPGARLGRSGRWLLRQIG